MNSTVALLLASLAAAPLTALAGVWRPRWAPPAAIVTAALAFTAALWSWRRPGSTIDRDWAPTWGLRLHFEADGLASLYALLATGIGLVVVVYASDYIPRHLHHQHRSESDGTRFYALLLLFMGVMVGLVLAQDLILIFLFWDLTAVASYFLIGYDRQRRDARISALMALQITGISAIGFLIGSLMLGEKYGTYQLPELMNLVEAGDYLSIAAGAMMIAALAKSAQFPFHFWLPRAMAAPTPVSAYLHSAAMVAAGVFLIGRIYPLIELSPNLLNVLTIAGTLSIATGGILALSRDNLKQLLAYSTISQYGYVVLMFGMGSEYGVAAASFYVIAHGLSKCALFLTAGAVSEATGARELSNLGGLWRSMPLLAVASGIAAAGLAGLPLTVGWFKDELFFGSAQHSSMFFSVVSVIAAGLTFAYMGRFWLGIFTGNAQGVPGHVSARMLGPIVALGALILLGGLWPAPFVRLAEAAAAATLRTPAPIHVSYSMNIESVMALAASLLGVAIILTTRIWNPIAVTIAILGAIFGPERAYSRLIYGLNRLSDRIHWIEVRDLRSRVASVLAPAAVLVGITLLSFNVLETFRAGPVTRGDIPVTLMLLVIALAAMTAAVPRNHFSMVLALSAVGFGLAVVYSLLSAPDVALVAVLIETILSLLFFGFLALLPKGVNPADVVPSDDPQATNNVHRIRDPLLALTAGVFAFVVAWGVMSRPAAIESVVALQIELTPEAHGGDIVTVILADFRGFDTTGEITVLGIAFLGAATLLRRRLVR